jgi:hypothetical protein
MHDAYQCNLPRSQVYSKKPKPIYIIKSFHCRNFVSKKNNQLAANQGGFCQREWKTYFILGIFPFLKALARATEKLIPSLSNGTHLCYLNFKYEISSNHKP